MSSKENILREIIFSNSGCNLEQLKSIVKINDDIVIIKLIIKILNHEINYVNRRSNKYSYEKRIKKFISGLNNLNNYINHLNFLNYLLNVDDLVEIKNEINELIKLCNYKKTKGISIDNEKILNKISEIIEINIKLKMNNNEITNNLNLYDFLDYIIFELQIINYVKVIFNKFPSLISLLNDNHSIFEKVIYKYIEQINIDEESYSAIYLRNILSYFLNHSEININNKQKQEIVELLERVINDLSASEIDNNSKQKKKYFLNEIINKLKGSNNYDCQKHININYKYGMDSNFSEEALDEISRIKKINNNYYRDLRNKYVITIDGNNATSLEDAISLEVLSNGNYLLGVYITDVANYIKAGTYLDIEAYKKGTTIYLPNKNITIFPDDLTYNFFSLKQLNNKLVISYLFEISPNMNIINCEVNRSLINVKKNFTYNDVDDILNKGKNKDDLKLISNLLSFSNKLKNNSIINYDFKNTNYCDEKYYDCNYNDSIGSKIIEKFMIMTNYYLASYFFKNDIPFIYRINLSVNDIKKIIETKNEWNNISEINQIFYSINNLSTPPSYSIKNLGHKGLNLEAYCHSTSPVRNYSSLVNQRLVKKFMIDKELMTDEYREQLERKLSLLAKQLTERIALNEEYAKKCIHNHIKKYKLN